MLDLSGGAMILFIDKQLTYWAIWASRRDDCGLGYVQSQLGKLGESGGGGKFGGLPPGVSDDDLHELQKIVVCLPFDLQQAVWQCYMMPGTAEDHADACGVSKKTYYRRLNSAHLLVMEALQVGIDEVPLLAVGYAAMVADLNARNRSERKKIRKVLTA